jgi:hypothetical protein
MEGMNSKIAVALEGSVTNATESGVVRLRDAKGRVRQWGQAVSVVENNLGGGTSTPSSRKQTGSGPRQKSPSGPQQPAESVERRADSHGLSTTTSTCQ